ncbi:MAG: TolC family protein [Bacteroidota bacterium]
MKSAFGFSFLLVSAFCTSSPLFAQEVTLNNLDEAISLAYEKNSDYQNFILNQEQADLEYKKAKNHRLPTVTGSFSGQRNADLATTPLPAEIFGGEPGQTIETQFGQEYTFNAGVSVSKSLFNLQQMQQAKLAKLNAQMVGVEQEQYEEFLEQSTSMYYYTALVAKKAIAVSESDLESAARISLLSKDKYEQGLIDLIAYNNSKISENVVRQNLSSNKRLFQEYLIELKKLLGMGYQTQILLSEDLTYELPKLYQEYQLTPDLSIKNADVAINQADMQTKISRSAALPSLSLNSYYGRQQFRDDFGLALDSDSWSNYSYLTLNLSIPIFNGFENRNDIKKNKISQEIAQNEREDAELTSKLEDQLLIKNYQSGLVEASLAKDNFQLYEENQRLTYEKYEEGLVSLDTYLRVFEDYVKAENTFLNNLSKVYSLYSQIIPRISL